MSSAKIMNGTLKIKVNIWTDKSAPKGVIWLFASHSDSN